MQDALVLAEYCAKVYLIHRRDEFRGAKILQKQVEALENIEVLYSHTVEEICGEDNVNKLLLKDVKAGVQKELPVDGIFIAVGIVPATKWLPDWIEKDEKGYVVATEEGETYTVTGLQVIQNIENFLEY